VHRLQAGDRVKTHSRPTEPAAAVEEEGEGSEGSDKATQADKKADKAQSKPAEEQDDFSGPQWYRLMQKKMLLKCPDRSLSSALRKRKDHSLLHSY